RLQRTRFAPLRSPLSRKPLGAGRLTIILIAAVLSSSCATTQPLVPFSTGNPHNYLVIHKGQGADFQEAECVGIGIVDDSDPRFNAPAQLHELLRDRIPSLPPCKGGETYALMIDEYHAGRGVCIDCGTGPADPQSGFAFLSMTAHGESEVSMAEWQYWRGGTARFMLEQFVFDLTNLWTYGVSKFKW